MKKLIKTVMELKSWICLSFTAAMLIYLTVEFVRACLDGHGGLGEIWEAFAGGRMQYGLILQLFILCACISLLQYVFFSGRVLKKPSYSLRMAVFAVLCFGLCVLFASVCRWFPMGYPGAWVSFTVIFLVAFGGISLGFELYYRAMGVKYDAALGRRQSEGKNDESMNKT